MNINKIIDEQSKKNLKDFSKILFKYKKTWIFAGILIFTITVMKLPIPLLTGYIIDHVISKGNVAMLNYICAGLVLLTLIYLALGFLQDYLLFYARNAITIRVRLKLFRHIQRFPLPEIAKREKGYLLARILDDPANLNGLLVQTFFMLIQSLLTLIVGSVVIFTINWKLALASMLILPFFVSSNLLFVKKIKYWNNRLKEQHAVISKELIDSLSALKTTKLFSLYRKEAVNFIRNLKTGFKFSLKQFYYDYIVILASGFFSALGPLLIIWYGGHEVISGNLTIGQLVAFSSLLGFLYSPTKAILGIYVKFQKSLVSLNRIYEILNVPSERDEEDDLPLQKKKSPFHRVPEAAIDFQNVCFSYNDPISGTDNRHLLNDINLRILTKEKIALLGPTGAGKSTLINLLTAFYQPRQGQIFIAGKNLADIPLSAIRKRIGLVSQEGFLFSNSIYNNIKIGNINAESEEILEAARLANALPFIESLPNGFETVVGQGGEYLSGGQRQLVCLARVILKNPPILILDEPTSAVDSKTERLLLDSIGSFIDGRTSIIISHRLSTILDVDRVIIMEAGRISDSGEHKELILRNEFYNKVYETQIKGFEKKNESHRSLK